MADIKLVVKVDERDVDLVRKNFKPTGYSFIPLHIQTEFVSAILNGVPVPRGHGNLKDIGKCDRKLFYQQCGGANSLITAKTAFDMLLSLPTIIEADNSGSEVKE